MKDEAYAKMAEMGQGRYQQQSKYEQEAVLRRKKQDELRLKNLRKEALIKDKQNKKEAENLKTARYRSQAYGAGKAKPKKGDPFEEQRKKTL